MQISARNKIERRNFIITVVGAVGTGKSEGCGCIGEALDDNFDVSHVCWSETQFMELVRTLPTGSVIVADETGCWWGNRDYLSQANRLLSYVVQTFRFKRFIILWNVPLLRQVDLNLRSMGDATIETVMIHRKAKLCEVKYKHAETNPITSQTYRKYPVMRREDGSKYTATRVFLGQPSLKFRREYVPRKEAAMNDLYAKAQEAMENMRKPKVKEEVVPNAECDSCGNQWHTNSKALRPMCACSKRGHRI